MFGTNESIFGDDGMLPDNYGVALAPVPATHARVPQIPGTVVAHGPAIPLHIPQVPGTVIVEERAIPQGVKQQPGTVIVEERVQSLPRGVKAQPGTIIAEERARVPSMPVSQIQGVTRAPPVPGIRMAGPPPTQGRGGFSVAGGLPPLPAHAQMQPGGHFIRAATNNMPLPGRPVGAPSYPSDIQRYGIQDGWGGASQATYRDHRSVNYASDGFVYRVYSNQSIDVWRHGKRVAAHLTAASSPMAYEAITAELRGQRRVDPAILIAAINAAALIGTAAIQAAAPRPHHKRRKFDSGALSVPPPQPVSTGIPVWVWVAGGGIVLLGLGVLVFSGRGKAADAGDRKAA